MPPAVTGVIALIAATATNKWPSTTDSDDFYYSKNYFIHDFGICAILQQLLWSIYLVLPASLTIEAWLLSMPSW